MCVCVWWFLLYLASPWDATAIAVATPVAINTTPVATTSSWRLRGIFTGIGVHDCCFATFVPCGCAAIAAQTTSEAPLAVGAFFAVAFLGDPFCVLIAMHLAIEERDVSNSNRGLVDVESRNAQLAFIVLTAAFAAAYCCGLRALRQSFQTYFATSHASSAQPAEPIEDFCMATCCCCCSVAQMTAYIRAKEEEDNATSVSSQRLSSQQHERMNHSLEN